MTSDAVPASPRPQDPTGRHAPSGQLALVTGATGEPVLVVAGEVDHGVVSGAEDVVAAAVGQVSVVDLAAVTFIDSAGVHLLLRLRQGAPGGALRLRGTVPSGLTRSVLDLLGLGEHFSYE